MTCAMHPAHSRASMLKSSSKSVRIFLLVATQLVMIIYTKRFLGREGCKYLLGVLELFALHRNRHP